MITKNLACHDKFANIAFYKQSEEFELAEPWSVQTVNFDYPLPVGLMSGIHISSGKGIINQVLGHG